MRVALDTNHYTDLARGDEAVADLIARAGFVAMPFPVLGELRAGFALGKHGRHNEAALRRFLAQPGVEALHSTGGDRPALRAVAPAASPPRHAHPDERLMDRSCRVRSTSSRS